MIFGDLNSFAVEFSLDQDYGGEWLFGRFCYWVRGRMLGNYDLGVSLRDVFFQMQSVVRDCGDRKYDWCDESALSIYSRLNGVIYGGIACEIDTPARYEISIPVDIFDECKAFLIDCGDFGARIVYSIDGGCTIEEAMIGLGDFDLAIFKCYEELGRLVSNFD